MELQATKTQIQGLASRKWVIEKCWGILSMATGTGKSKILVDMIKQVAEIDPDCVFVIVVPTRKLRDKNWKEEFEKWDALQLWETRVIKTCYASLKKLKGLKIGLLGLDECHRLTPSHEVLFQKNDIERCMGLTATVPEGQGISSLNKQEIFLRLGLKVVFKYTLLQALQDKVVADFEIIVVKIPLDNSIPYIRKSKFERELVTEQAFYSNISSKILIGELSSSKSTSWLRNDRARMIRELKSKSIVGKILVSKLKGRFLIFCGSKEQCTQVLQDKVFHSSSGDSAFNDFINLKIDQLAVVNAINEGHSLPLVDGILILDNGTKVEKFVQRVGRAIRYRENFKAKCYVAVSEGTVDYEWTMRILKETKLPYKMVTLNYNNV